MKTTITLISALLLTSLTLMGQRTDAASGWIEGDILVQLDEGVSVARLQQQLAQGSRASQLTYSRLLGRRSNTHLLTYDPRQANAQDLLAYVAQLPGVKAVQFNYMLESRATPNDALYSEQWDMDIINAPGVWEISPGGLSARGDTIVAAILDSGFDVEHEDLDGSVWHNKGEIPDDGADNDNNGYIDDVIGWNFKESINSHPFSAHGTSVAGVAGAEGNNGVGVTGVGWNTKLMLLTTSQVDHVISAYEYVIDQRQRYNQSNGAEGSFVVVTNASFGKSRFYCEQFPLWGAMYDLMGEVGVLTAAGVANETYNVENEGDMPTTCPSEFLITVTNTTIDDEKSILAAYGSESVDLGAPGDGSYTITLGNEYGAFGGSSASAPHVTGAIGLLYSLPCGSLAESAITAPTETARNIKAAILESVDPISDLEGRTVTGGRLNLFKSMEWIQNLCGATTGPLEIIKLYPNPTLADINLLIESPDFEDDYLLRAFNAMGQLVYRDSFSPIRFGPKLLQVDASDWSPGVYFIVINKGSDFVVRQVVVY